MTTKKHLGREALKPRNRIETRPHVIVPCLLELSREALKPRNRIETRLGNQLRTNGHSCREALKPRNRIETIVKVNLVGSRKKVAKL